MVLRIVLIVLGVVGILDSVFVQTLSNPNLGVYMPAILGLPLLVIGLFYPAFDAWMAAGIGRVLKYVFIAGYALFFAGFAVVGGMIFSVGKSTPEPGADAVIVLGAGLKNDGPSRTLQARLKKAAEYLHENEHSVVVVTGGLGTGQRVTEAQAAADFLISIGVDESRIYKEEKSTSTLENLRFAKDILESELGFAENQYTSLVVSSDYHIFRALKVAKQVGLQAQGLGSKSIKSMAVNFYLREYVAVVGYYCLGRL